MSAAAQIIAGGALTVAVASLHGERLPAAIPAEALLSLGYLVLFGSILAFSAYTYLLRHTTTALATSCAYVNPVLAVLLAAAVDHERPGLGMVGAGALVVLGVAILVLGRPRAS